MYRDNFSRFDRIRQMKPDKFYVKINASFYNQILVRKKGLAKHKPHQVLLM